MLCVVRQTARGASSSTTLGNGLNLADCPTPSVGDGSGPAAPFVMKYVVAAIGEGGGRRKPRKGLPVRRRV